MANSSLKFRDIWIEHERAVSFGKLKITPSEIEFKNKKNNAISRLRKDDIKSVHWQRIGGLYGLRMQLINKGHFFFGGLRNNDTSKCKVGGFFKEHYGLEMETESFCVTGRDWGTMYFDATRLSLTLDNAPSFEIPIACVTKCSVKEDNVLMRIRPNCEAAEISIELSCLKPEVTRPEIKVEQVEPSDAVPGTEGDGPTAGVLVAEFANVVCLTPNGDFYVRILTSSMELHGDETSHVITFDSIRGICRLPLDNGRQMYLTISLNEPIELDPTGSTNSLVLLFNKRDEGTVHLSMSETDIRENFDNKLGKEMSGRIYRIFVQTLEAASGIKVLKPRAYQSVGGHTSIPCYFGTHRGSMYVLKDSLVFVDQTAIHIHFHEIEWVEVKSDYLGFAIRRRDECVFDFDSPDRNEVHRLIEFIQSKDIQINSVDSFSRSQDEETESSSSTASTTPDLLSDIGADTENSDAEDRENSSQGETNVAEQVTRGESATELTYQ